MLHDNQLIEAGGATPKLVMHPHRTNTMLNKGLLSAFKEQHIHKIQQSVTDRKYAPKIRQEHVMMTKSRNKYSYPVLSQ